MRKIVRRARTQTLGEEAGGVVQENTSPGYAGHVATWHFNCQSEDFNSSVIGSHISQVYAANVPDSLLPDPI
jgi:hypothetical protein